MKRLLVLAVLVCFPAAGTRAFGAPDRFISVVVPDVNLEYFQRFLTGVQRAADENHFEVTVLPSSLGADQNSQAAFVENLIKNKPSIVLFSPINSPLLSNVFKTPRGRASLFSELVKAHR